MTDTPRRKRKAKGSAPLVLAKDTELPSYASLVVSADELHLLMGALAAAVEVNMSDDDNAPEIQERVEQIMFLLDNIDPQITVTLVEKLNKAHSITCKHAPNEFGES